MPDTVREQLQDSLRASYTLERELGGGGMSRAFVAAETALGRQVVVKVLAPELAAGLSGERFLREIQLTARMQHPNIVPVLTSGESAGLPYYTMPYIQGAALRARLEQGRMPLAEATSVLRDVARALAYAHDRGIVHRDVKPDNVLLSEGAGVVTDFGIAKAISASRTAAGPAATGLTIAGTSVGTPAYLAPEQALGGEVDPRTDVYSWGVMAYEALAGAHPFAGRVSAQALVAAHISEDPTPLATVAPDVPAALALLVHRCLAKDPDQRPLNGRAVVTELDAATSSPSLGSGGAARTRSRRTLWVGAAAAVIVIAVLAVLAMRSRSSGPALDPSLVAVLPFRVASGEPSLQYLREGMLDLIGAQLVRRPRTVDARSTLAAWRRAGGGPDTDLESREAARVAESLGASRVIQGDIVGTTERLTISAAVFEAPGGQQRARASATGAAAALPVLLDSVITQLLALDAGEGEQRAATLARIPLAALQAYLAGQAAYRRGQYADATNEYAQAIDEDSTFALAGIALANAAAWTFDERGARGLRVAGANPGSLGTRDRALLSAALAAGEASTEAEVLTRRERAVEEAPDVPELWYSLGDRYFHWGSAVVGEAEAMRRAATAFERALELDPTFTPALEHLPLLYSMRGDSARTREAYRRLVRDTSTFFHNANRAIFAPGAADRDEAVRRLAAGPPMQAIYAAGLALSMAEGVERVPQFLEVARARAATQSDRYMVQEMEYVVAMDGGRPAAAARMATSLPWRRDEHLIAATFWDGDSAAAASQFSSAVRRVRAGPPSSPGAAREAWVSLAYDVAQYELSRGDTTHGRQVIEMLRRVPRDSGSPPARERPARLAMVLDAQLAAVAGRPDARMRLESLDSLLALGPRGGRVSLAGNLAVSRLWEAAGELARARAAVDRWHAGVGGGVSFYSTYLRERARLSALTGDRAAAMRDYRLYLALRANAEPSLQPHLESVRREVRRLETR